MVSDSEPLENKQISFFIGGITETIRYCVVRNIYDKDTVTLGKLLFERTFDFGPNIFQNAGTVGNFKNGKLNSPAVP